MTGGEPARSGPGATPSTCVRCHVPLGEVRHVGWDPRGPVCENCWALDVDTKEQARWEKDLEEHLAFLREWEG